MNKRVIFILFILLLFVSIDLSAQCTMCGAAAEQSRGENGIGKGINSGIAFLAIAVYSVLGFIGYMIYRNYKKTGRDRENSVTE